MQVCKRKKKVKGRGSAKTEENGDGWSRIRGETLLKEERRVYKSLTCGIPEIYTATNKPNFPKQKIDELH